MDQTSISVSDSLRVYDNILQAIGHTPLIQLNNQRVLDPVMHDHVILVAESDRPVGILTKIDILDFIAQSE